MEHLDRRGFLAAGAALGGAALLHGMAGAQDGNRPNAAAGRRAGQAAALVPGSVDANGQWQLPKLPYAYDAVSEVIDAQTMELHHTKHHQAYVNGVKKAEEELAKARANNAFDLISHWENELAFNGGGHTLHCIFWDSIGPDSMGGKPDGALAEAIDRDFGSYDGMWGQLAAAAKRVQGSGWGMLAYEFASGKLQIIQGQNQHLNTTWAMIPLLPIDVWEHAYYLKYQNRRADYVDAFPKIINWSRVGRRFQIASTLTSER